MNVYLVGRDSKRIRTIQLLLAEKGIFSTTCKTFPADAGKKVICVLISPAGGIETEKRIRKLLVGGSLVVALTGKTQGTKKRNGILELPLAVGDSVLVSLISWFLSWKEKEAHFAWVTTELQKMNQALAEETARLKQTSEELDGKNRKIKEDLALANIIQNNMLPKNFPQAFPVSFAHKYIPHEYIGGDFFEVSQVDEFRLGILIADVSGHGVSSALITAMLKSSFTHAAKSCLSPSAVLSVINREFTQIMRTEHYITAFYCIIDLQTFECRYANAGHPQQIILRSDGTVESIGANGFFLGMFEQTQYDENRTVLKPGDRIVFFTDGVVECHDVNGVLFGRDNLVDILKRRSGEDIEKLSKNIIVELISFMSENRFPDDVTLLIAEIIPFI